MEKTFLSAQWKNLIMINYRVDEKLLLPYLPPHTELDRYQGHCYLSLVGFMFLDTKVWGISWPFHKNFEEVNLRFYVKSSSEGERKRGVVFIKEIVPKPLISAIANLFYNEHYCARPMINKYYDRGADEMEITYSWIYGDIKNSIAVRAQKKAVDIQENSMEEFITEHYLGYSRKNSKTSLQYTVEHPRWNIYPVNTFRLRCDFGKVYGRKFTFLSGQYPDSVFLAAGSEVLVKKPIRIIG